MPATTLSGSPLRTMHRAWRDDVERIRQHALVPANITIYGYIYDVKSGKLLEVPEATAIGKAA